MLTKILEKALIIATASIISKTIRSELRLRRRRSEKVTRLQKALNLARDSVTDQGILRQVDEALKY